MSGENQSETVKELVSKQFRETITKEAEKCKSRTFLSLALFLAAVGLTDLFLPMKLYEVVSIGVLLLGFNLGVFAGVLLLATKLRASDGKK